MTRFKPIALAIVLLSAPSLPALAAPVQIDFNVSGFGPTDETHQTFVKSLVGLPTLTFEALNSSLLAEGHLHWDGNDGNGYADGFGVRDFPGVQAGVFPPPVGSTYEQDEVEGDERLRLTFGTAVSLLSFNLTDFFFENESAANGLPVCSSAADPNCYRERGEYSLDGGATWTPFLADVSQLRGNLSNGALTVFVNQVTTSLILRAPGAYDVQGFPYRQLSELSLAGVQIDTGTPPNETPEPASLLLVGLGLAGLGSRRLRRR